MSTRHRVPRPSSWRPSPSAGRFSAGGERRSGLMPGQSRQITSGDFWQDEPALSPDGTRIAFTSDESGNRDIWIIGVRGGNPVRLTSDPADDYYPAWFPEGTAIAFVSDRGGTESIWKMDQTGRGSHDARCRRLASRRFAGRERIAFSILGPKRTLRIGVAPLANPCAGDPAHRMTGTDSGTTAIRHGRRTDGRICYATQNDLWTVPSSGGRARPLIEGRRERHRSRMDHRRQVYPLLLPPGRHARPVEIAASGGEPERFTWGTGYDHDPSICADGSELTYATQTAHTALRVRDLSSGKETMLPGRWNDYMADHCPGWKQGGVRVDSIRQGCRPLGAASRGRCPGGRTATPHGRDRSRVASHVFSPDGKWLAYYLVRARNAISTRFPPPGGQPIRFTERSRQRCCSLPGLPTAIESPSRPSAEEYPPSGLSR